MSVQKGVGFYERKLSIDLLSPKISDYESLDENKLLASNSKQKIINQKSRITELRKLMMYYKEITETVLEPFIILDKNLSVVTANMSFYRKFKVNKKDTEGMLIFELGNNQWDAPELRELLEHILPANRVLNNYAVTHDFPKLGRRTILLNARQVDSKQLILLAMEDITTAKMKVKLDSDKAAAKLIKKREEIQDLQDTKNEFISLASHQLRAPATVVKQYTGMLTKGFAGKMTKDQIKMINTVYESNERQLEIIEDLLKVAKVDDGKVYLDKLSCDVVQQVKKVIKQQEILFKNRGQTVLLNNPHQTVMAYIDPKLILMVLENVLDNAGKYSKEGEQVTIDIIQNKSYITVSIKDNGVGISKRDIHKLFNKFSRISNSLSASVRGTGLGLYWSRKILDLHGGSIEVTSIINKGSIFTVKMPIGPIYLQEQVISKK